jgi:hypothetical protein
MKNDSNHGCHPQPCKAISWHIQENFNFAFRFINPEQRSSESKSSGHFAQAVKEDDRWWIVAAWLIVFAEV